VNQQKVEIIRELERQILPLQGFTPLKGNINPIGLGQIESALPNNIFPRGAIHKCITSTTEASTASVGFIAGVIGNSKKAQAHFCG